MFEKMEISKHVYKRGKPYKTTTRVDYDHVNNGRKQRGVEAELPNNL